MLVTGGWDKIVKIWDTRSPTPAAQAELSDRVYAMDCRSRALVVGTADRQLHVFDLNMGLSKKMSQDYKSPLTYQTRSISIFADGAGFAIGCIEGRVALEYFANMGKNDGIGGSQAGQPANFVFKCHRDKILSGNNSGASKIFSVNSIDFHPLNTLATGGSDGVFSIWDKDARHRLRHFDRFKFGGSNYQAITNVKFSPQGDLLFYSLGYDWGMGHPDGAGKPLINRSTNKLMVHSVSHDEVKPKESKN